MPKKSQTLPGLRKPRSHYTEQQKLEAVKLFLAGGNLTTIASALDIPYITLQYWKKQQWWNDWVEEMKLEGKIKFSNRLKTLASKAMIVTEDRLENGDYVLNGLGELIRKPVTAAVANKIAIDMINTNLKMEQDQNTAKELSMQERLVNLAEKFVEMQKKKTVQVTDVIIGEEIAFHDESESLQDMREGESEDEIEIS